MIWKNTKVMFSDLKAFEFITDSVGDIYLIRKKTVQPKSLGTDEQIFYIVEDMPEFPGGELELRKFIANNIKYPLIAQENGIQGKVYVTFVVDKNGEVANAKIARGVDPSLDQEALRVVNSLPTMDTRKTTGTECKCKLHGAH
jgi:TonB family protein